MEQDSLEIEIGGEIERAKGKYGDEWGYKFFNNFGGNLPGGYRPQSYSPDMLDRRETNLQASERRRGQTTREFFGECASAVTEAGFTPDEIKEARGSMGDPFFEMLIPIYTIMRRRGYNHYPDLTS